jgi:hypothetical protein
MTGRPAAASGTSARAIHRAVRAVRTCWLVLIAALLAACASLTPAQERSAGEVRAFADRTARAYGLLPIHVLVSRDPAAPAGSFRRGFFSVSTGTLGSSARDAVVAHELAHYVLGHDAPLPGDTREEWKRAYQRRELDANAKSVEILARVLEISEARALRTVYLYLRAVQLAHERSPGLDLAGHLPPCEEIADLIRRFPQQRHWTASLDCAPPDLRSSAADP